MQGLCQSYSDARFNVAHNTWTSFAVGSTCLRMVYSIGSKTYRADFIIASKKEDLPALRDVVTSG